MANDDVQTNIRIPGELKERLQASAENAGRSLSAEVAYRVARSYELEKALNGLTVDIESTQQALKRIASDVATKDGELNVAMRELAAFEARFELLQKTRESDIDAATKFLQERVDSLAIRAGSAEREALNVSAALKSHETIIRTLAQFVITQNSLSHPQPGTEAIHLGIVEVASAVGGGDFAEAVPAVERLTPLLSAYVQLQHATANSTVASVASDLPPKRIRRRKQSPKS